MYVYIEPDHQNNFSQSLSICETKQKFSPWNITKNIKFWLNRSRQRKHLALLDDRLLNDIGYTRAQANKEISKPFWK